MFTNTIDKKNTYTNNDGIELVDLSDSIFNSNLKAVTCSFYKVTKEMQMRPDLLSIASFGEDTYAEMIIKYSEICNPFAIEEDDVIAVPSLNSVYNEVKDVILSNNTEDESTYNLVKNYHKYIDKSKVPSNMGSQTSPVQGNKNATQNKNISGTEGNSSVGNSPVEPAAQKKSISGTATTAGGAGVEGAGGSSSVNNSPVEPNMANNGNSGISIINGRIYFGPNVSAKTTDITDVDGDNIAESDLVDCAKSGVTIGQFLNATVKNSLKK